MTPRRIIISGEPEPSPLEPDAHCDQCGATSTIGRAIRRTTPPQIWRFCRNCWPQARLRLEAEWGEETERWLSRLEAGDASGDDGPPGHAFQSRAWADAVEFLKKVEEALALGGHEVRPADLAGMVQQIRALAPEMDGPVPPHVVDFIRRYGPPAG